MKREHLWWGPFWITTVHDLCKVRLRFLSVTIQFKIELAYFNVYKITTLCSNESKVRRRKRLKPQRVHRKPWSLSNHWTTFTRPRGIKYTDDAIQISVRFLRRHLCWPVGFLTILLVPNIENQPIYFILKYYESNELKYKVIKNL